MPTDSVQNPPNPAQRRSGRGAERWLTVADVCEQLQVSTDWVNRQVENGRIRHARVGKFLPFRQVDIDELMARRFVEAQTPPGSLVPVRRVRRRRTAT
jgi:excisionase family DNA binding protein